MMKPLGWWFSAHRGYWAMFVLLIGAPGGFTPAVTWAKEEGPAAEPVAEGPFKPEWDSPKQYQCTDWFRDAKFGIWAHARRERADDHAAPGEAGQSQRAVCPQDRISRREGESTAGRQRQFGSEVKPILPK